MGYPRLQESSSRDSTAADPKAGWQTGFNQSCGSALSVCRHMLGWEGRSKFGKAARSCPVRAFLRGWQRCLSGKIRIYLGMKGRGDLKGFKVAAVSQWRVQN